MTYGALVAQLVQDYEDYDQVNKQLDKMYVLPFDNVFSIPLTSRLTLFPMPFHPLCAVTRIVINPYIGDTTSEPA